MREYQYLLDKFRKETHIMVNPFEPLHDKWRALGMVSANQITIDLSVNGHTSKLRALIHGWVETQQDWYAYRLSVYIHENKIPPLESVSELIAIVAQRFLDGSKPKSKNVARELTQAYIVNHKMMRLVEFCNLDVKRASQFAAAYYAHNYPEFTPIKDETFERKYEQWSQSEGLTFIRDIWQYRADEGLGLWSEKEVEGELSIYEKLPFPEALRGKRRDEY